jgi:DNA-binding NarL/FixJ family response regulator
VVCGEAADGASAIEQAKVLKPDLVILDLVMPGLNGLETAAVLKNLTPRTSLVMLTLHGDQIKAVPVFSVRHSCRHLQNRWNEQAH